MKLTDHGVFLCGGVPQPTAPLTPDEGRRRTMAYRILQAHNQSGDERQLRIRFDAMLSHDITYVGIIQQARASGMKEFPLPYALTNCHNSLCAVGGTINEDDHVFGLSAAKKYGGIYVPANQSVIHSYAREQMAACGSMILGSDSHTRYGALGTMAVGEGGPELAKQLLAEAGYPDCFYLRIDARNDSDVNADQVSQAIASYLEKVGIQAEVNLLPRASFYEKTSAENLQSSFFMAGWGDSSGEGMVIFNDMLYTYDGKPGMGEGNRGHYSNAEVDALLDQASVEPDQAKRAALVEQVDQIARDEAAYIPLFFKHNIFGVRAGIQYTPSCDDHILAWDFTF